MKQTENGHFYYDSCYILRLIPNRLLYFSELHYMHIFHMVWLFLIHQLFTTFPTSRQLTANVASYGAIDSLQRHRLSRVDMWRPAI